MKRTMLVILLLHGLCLSMQAQKGLAIQTAFDELAVRQNATEVVMGAGRLKEYRLSLFHSLEIKCPAATEQQRIEELIRRDAAQAIMQEKSVGHTIYELPARKGTHHYIFYRSSSQSLILIYIEGKANLKQIKSFFLKSNN